MVIKSVNTQKLPSSLGLLVFFSVALNSDFAANRFVWWGAVAILAVSAFMGNKLRLQIRFGIQAKWWFLFTLLTAFGMLIAIDQSLVLSSLARFIVTMLVILILELDTHSYEDAVRVVRIYYAALVTVALYLLFFVDLSVFRKALVALTETGHWNGNEVGILMATGIVVALFLKPSNPTKGVIALRAGTIALFAYIMYTASSRKALAMLIFGLCVNLILKKPTKVLRNIVIVTMMLCGAYMLIMFVPVFYESIGWRMESLFSLFTGGGAVDSSTELRMLYVKSGWGFFKKSPLWGYGADNFRILNLQYNGIDTYAHNNFIEILVNFGLVGLFAFYWIFVKVIIDYVKAKIFDANLNLAFSIILMYLFCHIGLVAIENLSQILFIVLFFSLLRTAKDKTAVQADL